MLLSETENILITSAAPVVLIATSNIKLHKLLSRSLAVLDERARAIELDKAR